MGRLVVVLEWVLEECFGVSQIELGMSVMDGLVPSSCYKCAWPVIDVVLSEFVPLAQWCPWGSQGLILLSPRVKVWPFQADV